jgi:hypothetical protein
VRRKPGVGTESGADTSAAAEAQTWGQLSGRQPVVCGEQRCIHLTAGVFGRGAGPGDVSWATRPRWAGAGPVSVLTRKKKRREEENRKWAGWRMRPKKLFGI